MLTSRKLAFVILLLAGTAAAAQQSEAYRLGPGEKVAISVFGEDDLSMNVTLADNGVLKYPFLGDIRVAGLTVPELERAIADGLRGDYLINPEVTVTIQQYRPIFLNGEVNRPGGYEYQPGLTVEKALTLAGGLSQRAARGKIQMKRANSDSFVRVDVDDPVHAGDIINVPQSFF
jgi:protein involved in polysaccharide export with SLBB domain